MSVANAERNQLIFNMVVVLGYSTNEVARIWKISRSRVSQIIEREGIKGGFIDEKGVFPGIKGARRTWAAQAARYYHGGKCARETNSVL
jgi:transposase